MQVMKKIPIPRCLQKTKLKEHVIDQREFLRFLLLSLNFHANSHSNLFFIVICFMFDPTTFPLDEMAGSSRAQWHNFKALAPTLLCP